IQQANESLEEALRYLLKASATKGCILKILVRTQAAENQAQCIKNDPEIIDSNLLIIDSHELMIQEWLEGKKSQQQCSNLLFPKEKEA
ncbi:MAG TPA: hypothetical protein VE843_12450, partial [Ktedonobacteraceae bacterium]|nr:hypothetical protein [Ktedonobacteraceae bacterium]